MKKKGRFVLEAALLTPGICILLVYLVYFTLYAHDAAVLALAAAESGVKGIYREELSDGQIKEKIIKDLQQKTAERTLWVQDPQIEVQVSPIRAVVKVSGKGAFLQVGEIQVQQKLYRIKPCEIIRRSRWLKSKGEK